MAQGQLIIYIKHYIRSIPHSTYKATEGEKLKCERTTLSFQLKKKPQKDFSFRPRQNQKYMKTDK